MPRPPGSGVRAAPGAGARSERAGHANLRLVHAQDLHWSDSKAPDMPAAAEPTPVPRRASVATLSHEEARPTNLRVVSDTGSRGTPEGSPAPAPGLKLAAADVDVLVARAQRGDRWAFTELFRRHRADVARLVYRMMGPSADLEDTVQEVFLQVHRSIGEFRGQAKFSTWLHRVTVNVVLMARRAARSRPVLTGETPTEYEPDAGLAPDEDAMRRRCVEAFRRLLDRLPEKKRTVFELHELAGLSPAEISERVSAPVLTVRTRLFYARRELEAMMREEPALAQLAAELEAASSDDPSPAKGTKPGETRGEEAS
ncbi:MAG: RNA polymerase sigma factor [Polyangiaceae bacterium]